MNNYLNLKNHSKFKDITNNLLDLEKTIQIDKCDLSDLKTIYSNSENSLISTSEEPSNNSDIKNDDSINNKSAFLNNCHQIESKLMHIIMQNLIVENYLNQLQFSSQLLAAFNLIKSQKVTRSLLYNEEKEQVDLENFLQISTNIKMAAKKTELFLGRLLLSVRKQIRLPEKILQQLAD
ncbi:898_t:CDS:2 [Cetraspora pellucida]|uniref:898_t:CDS:1 n=1 Tax=Cetraspora pellucida TaxID=1433469 RepID=A0A9N9NRH5_9GLOM|nr:898_t:CDS:2 [Cetraspora pellucida]